MPTIYISSLIYAETNSLLKHPDTTTSSIIRTVMNALINHDNWSKDGINFTKIVEKFTNEYAACLGKLQTN